MKLFTTKLLKLTILREQLIGEIKILCTYTGGYNLTSGPVLELLPPPSEQNKIVDKK